MSARRNRVGGGATNATPRAVPLSSRRETPRNMSLSSRRTSPRWQAGNRLDKRRGLSHTDTLKANAASDRRSQSLLSGPVSAGSRRATPRWIGGNRPDKKSPAILLNQSTSAPSLLNETNLSSLPLSNRLNTGRNSVQSTSRSDAMRLFIGVDPKDATVKHTSYDPLAWYAPTISMVAPGKSVYVDHNEAARLKKHKTRSELMRTHKRAVLPHQTYDIDGDGIVNQSDLKIARQVDPKGLGVLDEVGTKNGKRSLARKYLVHNQKERWFKKIAPDIHAMPLDKAVEHIANVQDFSRTMANLRLRARPGNGTGGRGSRAALVEVDHGWASTEEERGPKIKTKVPATARDEGAVPEQNSLSFRPARSRSELFKTRKMQAIRENQKRFELEPTTQDNRRVDLITVPKAWTRCENTSKPFLKLLYEHKEE